MSAADDIPQTSIDDDSRGRGSRPVKEKKKRRRSRSKQKEIADSSYPEQDFSSFGAEDDGDNSCSSTPKHERSDEPLYPASGMICALCYCGEKSLLGQGDMTRYASSSGFNPFKKPPLRARGSHELLYGLSPGSNGSKDVAEKVTKTAAVQRRGSKQMRDAVKVAPKPKEYVDELSTVGCSEVLDVSFVFEPSGDVHAHHCCAAWSEGVTQNESYDLLCVDKAVHSGMAQRCHSCSRYGATIKCRAPKCERLFHYPCAAGSGCYQDIKSMSLLCTDHLSLATTIADPDELNCAVCDDPGQISDLLFCTSCGHHYHGDCLYPHVDVNPVVRAGWQCPECKICQTCRQPGDDNKMLVCDVCDKGYHTFCLRPPMTFIPKNGWCCKNCRRCTDCGSRTPGNGPSSRWHINYQVCDKCYQLRNKGSSCPVCSKAYRNIPAGRIEMTQCNGCKKWVHWGCEEPDHLEACQKTVEDYECPRCRNPSALAEEPAHSPLLVPTEGPAEDSLLITPQATEVPPVEELESCSPPGSESFTTEKMEEENVEPSPPHEEEIEALPITVTPVPLLSPVSTTRKRASTSSSIGSEKGNFALKGSSTDPMLCLGEDTVSNEGESQSIVKSNLESPPRKIRHVSSDETLSAKEIKTDHHSSAESNLSSLFTDENVHDTMQLFGVEALPHSGSTKTIPSGMLSPDSKSYKIPVSFVSPSHPKVTLSPLGSPASYGSPSPKPPGPGMGKPGGMFGTGKPFGHKRKPAHKTARSKGKGKGKGQKRGTWSGARKRPRGGIAGKGGPTVAPIDRNLPRKVRRGFPRQCSSSSTLPGPESGPLSPTTKVEPPLPFPPADDEYGDSMHNTVVLCSIEDTFTLSQDMCVVCGSFGKGSEGRLISCSQCGQCYHPFCVNLKLTKVVLRKGWRCLDCTVCEECGQVDDPAHLLLCDDCDISYHTHCLNPPLQHVPKGGWKCKWCVRCVHCGTTSPGTNCEWASNYTACGPCASLTHCPRCKRIYKDEDIIMQCGTCERWLHTLCECLFSESDIEKVLEKGYECCFCRPKGAIPPHLTLGPPTDPMYDGQAGVYLGRTRSEVEAVKEYHKDCTALTISGLQHIQEQMQKYMGLYKKRPTAQRGRGRKPSLELSRKIDAPALIALEDRKPKQSLGQSINVAAAVTALQEPADVIRRFSADGTKVEPGFFDGRILPVQLPVSTAMIGDLSSATATATEDSGMEGNERAMRVDDMKSPEAMDLSLHKNVENMDDSSMRDETRSVLGVKEGGIKRRRKPYRPGIGGFMVRQRGRGGLFKTRSRHPVANKTAASDSRTDTVASETASDVGVPPLHIPYDDPTKEGTGPVDQSGSTPQFIPPTENEPNVSVVSPLKLKISTRARKRRKKLIDQFPPYLQDAFFGKKIITDAKAKSSPLENMNEKPASPEASYVPNQAKDSCLMLPDRLTQRLETLVSNQANVLANIGQSASHSNSGSQRHSSHLQDDESLLMDRENEQELLGVLPDLPFIKVDEFLGMFSSDLKPEQGANDSSENILSPSSLEKMVRDGLANIDNIDTDMAELFSDVLNHQSDATSKQDNDNLQQGDTHTDVSGNIQQMLSTDEMSDVKSEEQNMIAQASGMTVTSSNIQSQQVSNAQRQEEQQRKLAIEQELQQIEIKQRQQQFHRQHVIQRQMSANLPLTGYGMGQQDVQSHHSMGMSQNRQVLGASVTPGPHGMSMVGQHMDPRPHSHHATPVMSPVPMVGQQSGHSMTQMHHPGQSPHITPPPPATMFSRQTSMPILPGHADMLGVTQMHPQMQIQGMPGPHQMTSVTQRVQGPMHVQPPPSITPGLEMHAMHTGTPSPRPQSVYVEHTNSGLINQVRTNVQSAAVIHPGSRSAPLIQQVPRQVVHNFQEIGEVSHPLPPEAYLTNVAPAGQPVSGADLSHMKSSDSALPHGSSTSSATGLTLQDIKPVHLAGQQSKQVHVAQETTTLTSINQATMSTTPVTQQSEGGNGAPPLPDFPSDNNLFEPSPPPWPLGTELDGDCLSVNQRNILKWEKDEPLGDLSTISPVLYANVKHQELKKEFPDWQTRAKQIAKLWRKASTDERAPFLLKARDNRALLKISRERSRGDASKTPTPPIAGEESDNKTNALKLEPSEHLATFTQAEGPSQDYIKLDNDQQTKIDQSMPLSFAAPANRDTETGQSLPPDYNAIVKQQPKAFPVNAYFAGQATMAGQSDSVQQSPTKTVYAKVERRPSVEAQMQSTVLESPSKTGAPIPVTRSLSLGARIADSSVHSFSTTPKVTTVDQAADAAITPPTSALDPKNRRLSVDSQMLQQTQGVAGPDIKPSIPMSPNPAQIRQVIYQQSTQKSSRRARLWEQSQPPPPPYPSQSPGTLQAGPRFMYSQMQGPRVGMLSPGGSQAMIRAPSPGMHGSNMIAFPFEGAPSQNIPPGHPMHHGFSGGVHPVRGQHPPGAYIELRHSDQSDPATRRQNILRIGNVCSTASPHTMPSSTTDSAVPVESKVTQVKTSVVLSQPSSLSVVIKSEDPFAGGHMPHDDAIDALLRSDEFKDLHFQGSSTAAVSKVPDTSTTFLSKPASTAATCTTSLTQMVTLTSQPSTIFVKQENITEDVLSLEKASVEATSTDMVGKDERGVELEIKPDEVVESDKTEVKSNIENTETDEEIEKKDALKTDHSYFKSKSGIAQVANKGEASSIDKRTNADKPKVNVDIHNEATTDLRGVGLTPPPESEVAAFIPNEEESRQDAPVSLTVSNVITVPGTPPHDSAPKKIPADSSEKSNRDASEKNEKETKAFHSETEKSDSKMESTETETGKKLESGKEKPQKLKLIDSDIEGRNSEAEMTQGFDSRNATSADSVCPYEIQPLPKSPAAPTTVHHLAKFAKIPDVPPTMLFHTDEKDSGKEEEKEQNNESDTIKKTVDMDMKIDDKKDENLENIAQEDVIKSQAMVVEESSEGKVLSEEVVITQTMTDDTSEPMELATTRPAQEVLSDSITKEKSVIEDAPVPDNTVSSIESTSIKMSPPSTVSSSSTVVFTTSHFIQQSDPILSTQSTMSGIEKPAVTEEQASKTSTTTAMSSELHLSTGLPATPHAGHKPDIVSPELPTPSLTQDLPKTPVKTCISSQHPSIPLSVTPPQTTHISPTKDETKSTTTPPRQKPLLIKEQPLLLQELLEEEKREQEKARREKMRHTQTLLQQQVVPQPPGGMPQPVFRSPGPPVVEMEKVPPDSGIDNIKMEFLSRMNQAAQAGLSVVPPPGQDGSIAAPGTSPLHQQSQQGLWPPHIMGLQQAGIHGFGNDSELRRYRNWLIQHQQIMQIQVPKQEQLVQAKKTRKQSLMKKRNQYKRNGKEFSLEDTEELKVVTKQYMEAQQQLEKFRTDQKKHAELVQDFNYEQKHIGGAMGPGMQQQPAQQMIVTQQFQPQLGAGGQQQQQVMMQPGQQQILIKTIPVSTNVVGTSVTNVASVDMPMQQQQPQVVIATQQQLQQQQAIMTQFQKIQSPTNPLQQIMINQHQLQQQQIQQNPPPQGAQPRPQFMASQVPQSSSSHTTAVSVSPGSGHQTHDALMQMQMLQLRELQIEQQQQYKAFRQNPEKPKRRRKKKKSQAEKDAEEQQALVQQQMHHMQQQQAPPMPGTLPITNQQPGATWTHRPGVQMGMGQQMQGVVQPQMMMVQQQRPRFSMLPGPGQHQPPGGLTTVPPPARFTMAQMPQSPMPPNMATNLQLLAPGSLGLPQSIQQVQPPALPLPTVSQNFSSNAAAFTPSSDSFTSPPNTSIGLMQSSADTTPKNTSLGSSLITSTPPGGFYNQAAGMMSPMAESSLMQMPVSTLHGQIQLATTRAIASPSMSLATLTSTPIQQSIKSEANQIFTSPNYTPQRVNVMQTMHPYPGQVLIDRTSPRIHSPGQAIGNFDGLSEAEIAILMAHDPDLNSVPGTPTTPLPTVSTPPHAATIMELDDRSPKDDPRKKKKMKKLYVMDEKAINTIDSSIERVIRLSVEYEDRLQAAGQEGQAIQSPWQLEPKPTKFPPRKLQESIQHTIMGDIHGDPNKNKELLKHLLKTGQMTAMPGMNMSDVQQNMYGQVPASVYGGQTMIQGLPAGMMAYNQMQQEMGMGMMSYTMKPQESEIDQAGQKKKRSRRGSKETGPDGKQVKRKRKKDKNGNQQHQQQFQLGNITEGGMQMMMQGLNGKPGVMAPMVQFSNGIVTSGPIAVGQISPGQVGGPDINKAVAQWKPLPLLRLIEPEIRKTHHMCVPKGTGLTERKFLLGGKPGDSSYKGIPDLYEILLQLVKETSEKAPSPPTPPASLPPSPTRKQQAGQMTTSAETITQTTSSDAAPTISYNSTTFANKYGPLGLAPQETSGPISHLPQVTVPDSLPTPPHQGIDEKEDPSLRPAEDFMMPPSSPEMEEEDDWLTHSLTSLRNDDFRLFLKTSPHIKSERIRDSPSPTLPFMSCPKLKVPVEIGRGQPPLNDKDSVSVTIEFDNANIKSIEKSLTILSRILDTSIISYSMVEMIKPDKKLKEALSQVVKEEHTTVLPVQTSQADQPTKNQPDEITKINTHRHRRCVNCKAFVTGNGVRKPQFDDSIYDEDVIFCNKDCYIRTELIKNKVLTASPKKKFKASHIYQRHTQKISMATLLEKFPEEEPAMPLKHTRSSLDAAFVPSGVHDQLRGMSGEGRGRGRGRRRGPGDEPKIAPKRWRGVRWKKWSVNITVVKASTKPPVDIEALLVKYGSALKPPPEVVDKRVCVFCDVKGDGGTHTTARLLNVDVDRWVHLNCALWSAEVYETQGGALINVDLALRRSESVLCCLCQKKGATIHCHRPRCVNTYHCQCALDIRCVFFKDKTVLCPTHAPRPGTSASLTGFSMQQHHSSDTLRSLAVYRKVYVQRPETKQIASIMQQGELAQGEKNYMLRVGALIFENVGQLATHQMAMCHSKTAIYPIGYKATRMFWSSTNMRRRCKYECTVHEVDGKPMFMMKHRPALPGKNKPDKIRTHSDIFTCNENVNVGALWLDILKPLEKLRSQHNVLKLFPDYINGEKLFGLTTSVVSRILESLPNIELCAEYRFRYGRTPLLEVPLAINPTGCARSEPHIKQHRKKPHTLISNLISEYYESSGIGDASSLYGKQFVHSKSSQYRKMKQEWRTNVYLARSRIQGLGLFSARDIEPGTMVIEYIGDIIRIEVSEKREKMYEATNRGVYMFKLDSDHIVDATVTGGPARYINHSCKPNCVAEVVNFEKEKKIMIVSNRHLLKGEELSYDYKFDFEDEGRKIPCLCGASNCKKWMN